MLETFIKGLLLGFSIAAPVGPIGVLCIRRTLAEGRAAGFVSGLGAATADAAYGAIAGFGLTFISAFLLDQSLWLKLIGGGFLIYLGTRTFIVRPVAQSQETSDSSLRLPSSNLRLLSAYLSTLGLTLTNPATILSFVAVFAGLGVGIAVDYSGAAILVTGVFIGSALWWLTLSFGVGLLRGKFDAGAMRWVNRVSGTIITGFGIVALLSLLA
ncbi:MAG TPA: LysE family transporter [Anaerolineales bacterium]|nr:LysE family transporter [Anaerolineales bacterium]